MLSGKIPLGTPLRLHANRFKYKFLSVIAELRLTVTVVYTLPKKHITYLIEIKEQNSNNIFPVTVNENLYFKKFDQLSNQKVILYWYLKVTMC